MDDNWFKPFPTRTGDAQGGATERTMAAKVGESGFRTAIQNNHDGSVTMMRTRGGAAEYTTTPAPKKAVVVSCAGVMGPIQETDYSLRQWYSASDTDGLSTEQIAALALELTMTSTDGIFKFMRQPLKKMVGTIGVDAMGDPSTTPVTIWFARSATTMPVADPLVTGLKVTERAARTYYDAIPAHGKDPHSFGLHYAIQRVKKLSLKFSAANSCDSVMTFSKDVAGTPKTDFGNANGASAETGLANRTFYAGGGMKRLKLAVGDKLNQWDFQDKGWFLDYIGGDNAYSLARRSKILEITGSGIPVFGAPDLRPDCANLSKVQMFGQMWHGLATADGVKTPSRTLADGTTVVNEQTRKIYDFVTPPGGDTYFVKSPATLPTPVTPDSLLSIGAKFTNYALFSGKEKRYSCTASFELGAGKFIHFDENNTAHVLSLEAVGFSTGLGGGAEGNLAVITAITIKAYDWGKADAFNSSTKTQIFQQTVPVPITFEPSGIVNDGPGTHVVSASSTGRKAIIEIVEPYDAYTDTPTTDWIIEVSIPAEKTGITGALIWSKSVLSDESTGQASRIGTVTDRWYETFPLPNGNPNVIEKWYENGVIETVYLPRIYKRRMVAVAGYAANDTLFIIEGLHQETSGVRTTTARYYRLLRRTTIRPATDAPTPMPDPVWEFTDSAPSFMGYATRSWLAPTGPAYDWLHNVEPSTVYSNLPNTDSFTDNTKQYTCGNFPPTVITSQDRFSTLPMRVLKRVTNNIALLQVHNASVFIDTAFIYPGGYVATSNPAPMYATFDPVTEDISVGDTPRCFV